MLLLAVACVVSAIGAEKDLAGSQNDRVDDMEVNVQLGERGTWVEVWSVPGSQGLVIADGSTLEPLMGQRFRSASVLLDDSQISVNGKRTGRTHLAIVSADSSPIAFRGERYRGRLEARVEAGLMVVSNVLPLHWYLSSVVGAEMPDWAPTEALKAQSVVSRSYVLHKMQRSESPGPSLCDSVLSQAYRGISSESPETVRAVQDTSGLVLTYKGQLIDACFSAESGGFTASAEDVWEVDVPYLKGKKDPYNVRAEYDSWRLELSLAEIERLATQSGNGVGKLTELSVVERDASGRASRVALSGSKCRCVMRGTDLRLALGTRRLRSTMFDVVRVGDVFVFSGKGYGHGVGLSQLGACRMAESGRSYKEILEFYYTDVVIGPYMRQGH